MDKVIRIDIKEFLRKIAVCGAFLTLLSGFARPLEARVVAVDANIVNVRQGASIETLAIGKVKSGQIFGWYGAAENWTKIKLADGSTGYVRNDLLKGYDELTVTGSLVRVRKTPGLDGEILGKVSKGTVLPVLDHQDGWFKVQLANGVGWISGDYIKLEKPIVLSSTVTAGEPVAANPDVTSGPSNNAAGPGGVQPVTSNPAAGILSGRIIVIDPGHGVNSNGLEDPGAKGVVTGNKEKDINLDMAFKLKAILEKAGATVIMTHTGDTPLDLYTRAAIANNAQAHLFVSIHSNSSVKASLGGHSTYFYAPKNHSYLASQRDIRQKLAQLIQAELVKAGGLTDLGVMENNFVVIRETYCPSVLVETAFLSNAREDQLLAQGAYRQQLAQGIANGIFKYFGVA